MQRAALRLQGNTVIFCFSYYAGLGSPDLPDAIPYD